MPDFPIARVLIVDDQSAQMKALCDTLEPEGYETVGFTSATAALVALQQREFDLVLADLQMPEMNGISLLQAALEMDPNLVGIVMTGHGTIDTAVRAMQAGALDYIQKPFRLSAIQPVLARALTVRRLRMENIQLHEAVGIYKLSMAVASAFDVGAVLEKIAEAALGQSRVTAVSILLPTADGDDLRAAITRGAEAWDEGARIPFSPAISEWVDRSRELFSQTGELADGSSRVAEPVEHIPHGVSVPMLSRGKFVGILNFRLDQSRPNIAPGQSRALNILASAAASALDRASLVERLRDAEQRYRRLTENAPDVVFRYEGEPRGALTYINPAVREITGYSAEEHYADPALGLRIIHPDDRPKMEEVLRGNFPDGNAALTLRYIHRNGNQIWLEQRHMLVTDQHGSPVAIEGIARDVTGRRQLEEELRQAQKMEVVGRLAGGVAHDFNNLLTVINGYSNLLLKKPGLATGVRANLSEIKRAGEHAAALTRQLLAFSRRQVLHPEVLNVNAIVETNAKILQRMIGEDIELVTRLDPDLGSIKADSAQIEQIIMNLVANSRDAMPRGGRLTIETRNVIHGESAPQVMLAVADNGSGMDSATQSRIFEPFFTTKESGSGTGLGLSIVHGVVKQGNGTVCVDSEPGRGTTFRIHFPRVEEPQRVAPVVVPEAPTGSETILLVEDNPVVRRLVSTILELGGYRVLSARDGREALQIAGQPGMEASLVVTDLVMPGMSGPSLMETILRQGHVLPVLYISGYADDTVARCGYLEPGTPFLQKPFTPEQLLEKVRSVLDKNQ